MRCLHPISSRRPDSKLMTRLQEVNHKTAQGCSLRLFVEEVPLVDPSTPPPLRYCYHFYGIINNEKGTTYYKHPKDREKPLEEQYVSILRSWFEVLANKGDAISELDNPSNCELLSPKIQREIRSALNAEYLIKVNGEVC